MSEMIPAAGVTVADLYRELVGMRSDIIRALEKLAVIDAQSKDISAGHADHEMRIRSLEAFKYKLIGVLVLLAALAGFLGSWLGIVVHR